MSDVYNPENSVFEQLESMSVEVRRLARKLEQTSIPSDRRMLEQQLQETNDRLDRLRRRLRPKHRTRRAID